MPIVNGKYEMKIATVFATPKEAIEQIKKKIAKARKLRINNIPMPLLDKLAPLLTGKDVRIILPAQTRPTAEIKKLGPVAVTTARIYKDYKGAEANTGSVSFADRIFEITWTSKKILDVTAMDYDKCVKCLRDTFELAWRYAKKT